MYSKMHEVLTSNRSISQNTPKSGGIKTALMVSIDTVNQVTFNTGRNSNQWYIQSRESSSMTGSMIKRLFMLGVFLFSF